LPAVRYAAVPPAPELRTVSETIPSAIFLDQVRLNSLESERDELKLALEKANKQRQQAEEKALVNQKQARYLAAALRAAQEAQNNDQQQKDTVITGAKDSASES